MKLFLAIFSFFIIICTSGQDIVGNWNGTLQVQGIKLRLVFNISETDEGYSSTMDSPDQGAKGIPVSSTKLIDSTLVITMPNAGIEYKGRLENDSTITGTFKQLGQSFPLSLVKSIGGSTKLNRPQEPATPYAFYEEDVVFHNKKAKIDLAGTLALPKKNGKYPVVILITGSGPQNRNSEIFGHKPFLVITDYLTKKGFAVLRYDDRGIGKSEGDFGSATTEDLATDVKAAIKYLKKRPEIVTNRIGLIGHSEGGAIAPLVASSSKDVSFIVLLAGPALRGDKLLLLQKEKIELQSGIDEVTVKKSRELFEGLYQIILTSNANNEALRGELKTYLEDKIPANQISAIINQISSPWMYYFIKYDPVMALSKVKCPVLALNGENDLQVPPKENLELIKQTLKESGNTNFSTVQLKKLNHLFQESDTGLPSEYGQIEQTFSPVALDTISTWLIKQTKND